MDNKLIIRIKNDISELGRVVQLFHDFSVQNRLPIKISNAVDLVLDEIVNNIISYGYDDQNEHQIDIFVFIENGMLNLQIEDDARRFNPLGNAETDTSSSMEERKIGGLGLHFIRNMMDEISYKYINKKNCLIMKKQITEK